MNFLLNPILSTSVLSGLVFIGAGLLMLKKPPKKINDFYGYRTRRSKLSQEAWDFSQAYSGNLMKNSGLALIAFGFLSLLFGSFSIHIFIIEMSAIIIGAFYPIYLTEKKLKELFDEKGRRKAVG
ncbi:MAG: hypothetical protein QG635_714 [Bacteroidota bacterium]|nr:hypothetical protein [Bacteroidota bacterium]